MDVKKKITSLENENKLYEAMMRKPDLTYKTKGDYGRQILANNKEIKRLEKLMYERVYTAS